MPRSQPTSRHRQWRIALAMLITALLATDSHAASRIAALDPGHAGIIEALGASERLVLTPTAPSFEQQMPKAERYHRMPSAESLLAQRPDLLIGGTSARHQELLDQAERLGIETVMIERTLPPTERVRRLAEYVDRVPQGRELIKRIEQGHAAAAEISQGEPRVKVLHLSSSGAGGTGTVTGAGAATSADALIERAGGINVGAEAGLERYQSLSAEGVISMAPEAILVSDQELPDIGGADGIWERIPGLAHTPAAQDKRLIVLDHAAVKYDGATSGSATRSLAEALHTP